MTSPVSTNSSSSVPLNASALTSNNLLLHAAANLEQKIERNSEYRQSFIDPSWNHSLLTEHNILQYFGNRSNPFYDTQCNNELLAMQGVTGPIHTHLQQMHGGGGVEYAVHIAQPPVFFVIVKQVRRSPTEVVPRAFYYVVNGTVFRAPDLGSLVNSRLHTCFHHLNRAFSALWASSSSSNSSQSISVSTLMGTASNHSQKKPPTSHHIKEENCITKREETTGVTPSNQRSDADKAAHNTQKPAVDKALFLAKRAAAAKQKQKREEELPATQFQMLQVNMLLEQWKCKFPPPPQPSLPPPPSLSHQQQQQQQTGSTTTMETPSNPQTPASSSAVHPPQTAPSQDGGEPPESKKLKN